MDYTVDVQLACGFVLWSVDVDVERAFEIAGTLEADTITIDRAVDGVTLTLITDGDCNGC